MARWQIACAYIEMRNRGTSHEELAGLRFALKTMKSMQRTIAAHINITSSRRTN